jgi:hypothetical protein
LPEAAWLRGFDALCWNRASGAPRAQVPVA